MIIYLDGADLCGKTTLITKLQALLSFKGEVEVLKTPKDLLPRSKDKSKILGIRNFYLDRLKEIEESIDKKENKVFILDRFYLSEKVYGRVMRNYRTKAFSEAVEINNEIIEIRKRLNTKTDVYFILLIDKLSNVVDRLKKVGDDYIEKEEQLGKLIRSYKSAFTKAEKHGMKVYKINVFKNNKYRAQLIEEVAFKNFKYIR